MTVSRVPAKGAVRVQVEGWAAAVAGSAASERGRWRSDE